MWSRLAACSGTDPTGCTCGVQMLVDVIDNNLAIGRVDQVPPAVQMPAMDINKQVVDKLYCICHQQVYYAGDRD